VPSSGNGSGVAFKSTTDGGTYIITNNHVVENADTLTVRDATGQSIKAELIGTDPESDIAVVKVDRKIPVIKIANSGRLSVGQAVVAIGSPFGLERHLGTRARFD
jgi:serine protease Do